MALEECRECDHEVSTEAEACPNCGAPHPTRTESPKTNPCPSCGKRIRMGLEECPHCGRTLGDYSDNTAGCLGLLLGPVGLWYKQKWAAGFAWLAMAVLFGILSGGWLAPFFWFGMAAHAYAADPE